MNLIYKEINGNISYTKGQILHLWHGKRKNRNLLKRHNILKKFNFDPKKDLRLNKSGCWETRENIEKKIAKYFYQRKEE